MALFGDGLYRKLILDDTNTAHVLIAHVIMQTGRCCIQLPLIRFNFCLHFTKLNTMSMSRADVRFLAADSHVFFSIFAN